MTSSSNSRFTLLDLPPSPHHPSDNFGSPNKSFVKARMMWCSCQAAWFRRWPHLHYDEAKDCIFCHICVLGFKNHNMRASNAELSLVSTAKCRYIVTV